MPSPLRKQDEDPASRLTRLLDNAEPRIREQFLVAVNNIRNTRNLTELADLIETGRIDEAFEFINVIMAGLAASVTTTFVDSGVSTATVISNVVTRADDIIGPPITFDLTNVRAVEIMRQNRLRMIREFAAEQRRATQEALIDGISRGANPREQARAFRRSIGLTQTQMQAVNNFRTLLEQNNRQALTRALRDRRFDRTIESAIRTDTPLTTQQIDRMVDRYSERYLRYRSEVIARTETLSAVHQGSEEMYQQAIDEGVVNQDDLIRTWVTAGDARVRDTHNGMNGQQRPIGQPFVSDAGNLLRHPGDPNAPASEIVQCRCVLTTRFA